MTTLQIVAILATVLCASIFAFYFIKIVKLGAPKDLSVKSGSVRKGVIYSNTIAMLPQHKESAYLHLPTYSMGIIFHIGTFIALLLYILSFFTHLSAWLHQFLWTHLWLQAILLIGFSISTLCGIALFLKRIVKKNLRQLSHIDDFISNGLVTLFQCMTLLFLFFLDHTVVVTCYYISAILLFLYMPVGKLRHALYFFAARYHLGFFYGWRNVWPTQKKD